MPQLKIATVAYNKPEFIEYQYRSFVKFIKNTFEYIVYDNASDDRIKKEIHSACSKLNIQVVSVASNLGDDSTRAGASLDYAINDLRKKGSSNVLLIDSDIFLTSSYDAVDSLEGYDLIGIPNCKQGEKIACISYYTNQLLQMDLSKLPVDADFSLRPAEFDNVRVDCGGLLYRYFLKYPGIKHKAIKSICGTPNTVTEVEKIPNCNRLVLEFFKNERDIFKFENNSNFSEFFQEAFIHLRAGSNWIGIDAEKQKFREENLYKLINLLTQ